MKKALLWIKKDKKCLECQLCNRNCRIGYKQRGFCGVRQNAGGKLYSLNYGNLIANHVDPIEKKPLFHFLPGSYTYSIATAGCNFVCKHCQNADISQYSKYSYALPSGLRMSPIKIIESAQKNGCPSISYTYTEPTVFFEYALDTMKLAFEKGIKNIWVSNGYMSKKCIQEITPYLDAINIDLKGFSNRFYDEICQARLKPVLDNIIAFKNSKIHLEITTLVIPQKNDDYREFKLMAEFIAEKIGLETPWHLSRFFPAHQLNDLEPTSYKILDDLRRIAEKTGLKYVYLGNVHGYESNTCCPVCRELVIQRKDYHVKLFDHNGKCCKCGYLIY